MSTLIKKLVVIISFVILLLFIVLLILSWNLGAFAPVELARVKRQSSYFIAPQHDHPHTQSNEIISEIEKRYPGGEGHGILLLDNPYKTPLSQVRCRAGLFRADSLAVTAPFQVMKIDTAQVLRAAIDANPTVALFKLYPALVEWMQRHGYAPDTTRAIIESYPRKDRIQVEIVITPAPALLE